MDFVCVWSLCRGIIDPPEPVSDEDAMLITQYEQARIDIENNPKHYGGAIYGL